MTAYLSLGANLGDRAGNLAAALARLEAAGVRVERVSSLYETAPVGGPPQPPYLNLVARVETSLPPRELLRLCLAVEAELGRVRTVHWGPRTVDIDLLLYEGATSDDLELTLPHPRMAERQFVLVPLAEIAPDLRLPDGRTAAEAADPGDPGVTYWTTPPAWRLPLTLTQPPGHSESAPTASPTPV
jgi:2-amino-4-hydroxy-6-hydroxymethyldihydropteridine diphosphokinase